MKTEQPKYDRMNRIFQDAQDYLFYPVIYMDVVYAGFAWSKNLSILIYPVNPVVVFLKIATPNFCTHYLLQNYK